MQIVHVQVFEQEIDTNKHHNGNHCSVIRSQENLPMIALMGDIEVNEWNLQKGRLQWSRNSGQIWTAIEMYREMIDKYIAHI